LISHVLVVGGGMITHDQILPSLLHLQRVGIVGPISVCASRAATVQKLRKAPIFAKAFPGQTFQTYPADGEQPQAYKQVIAGLPEQSIVIVAVPDDLHVDVVMTALRNNHHVCCVKPLALRISDSIAIENEARARGLFVGIEYHKRFDDRSLLARRRYREGRFGHFRLGTAWLMEKWYYRNSNFQNWCTTDKSDAFTYIGCHYVDLVHFITGLLPVAVSVYGLTDRYPNGNEGFLWTDARVIWNNGACLNVQNSLSFPDAAPGTNTQGMRLHCSAHDCAGFIDHSDQYRGIAYCFSEAPKDSTGPLYTEPSTDYFQYLDLGGKGLIPVGYGYRSIEQIVSACIRISSIPAVENRRAVLKQIDDEAILATPANSRYNELVIEAARLSIANFAREAVIHYGDAPGVKLR
jgi:D-galacturonate reductase